MIRPAALSAMSADNAGDVARADSVPESQLLAAEAIPAPARVEPPNLLDLGVGDLAVAPVPHYAVPDVVGNRPDVQVGGSDAGAVVATMKNQSPNGDWAIHGHPCEPVGPSVTRSPSKPEPDVPVVLGTFKFVALTDVFHGSHSISKDA